MVTEAPQPQHAAARNSHVQNQRLRVSGFLPRNSPPAKADSMILARGIARQFIGSYFRATGVYYAHRFLPLFCGFILFSTGNKRGEQASKYDVEACPGLESNKRRKR
jgi:hypothetical protein